MQALAVYLPSDRLRALASDKALPERAIGAVLFADISGFTPLTEALSQKLGPKRGAEELTEWLNRVYDRLISEIDRFAGSVIGFSGDAITCWFSESTAAVSAALAIQERMNSFVVEIIDLKVELAVKVAVASGAVRRFVVGDPKVQLIDVIAGSTLERMAEAEHLAKRGEILVDKATVYLSEGIKVREWRDGFAVIESGEFLPPQPRRERIEVSPELLRPWLLPAAYERLVAGQGEFLTELRPVVVMFLLFGGLDYDNDQQASTKLDAYICWVQSVLTRFEATLLQVTIGDKGSYLDMAFGAPLAHEDDDRRALLAAFELLKPPFDFIDSVRIGISKGGMCTGAYGSQTRRTYGVLGDEGNVAARLMTAAAEGQILVTSRVYKATGDFFTWQALPAIEVKGKSEPIPIFWPQELKIEQKQRGQLIGRESERTRLNKLLKDLEQGESNTVLIEGEAGIGKSRLLGYLAMQARALGFKTLVGAGNALEQTASYHAWRGVFRQFFHLEPPGDLLEVGLSQVDELKSEEKQTILRQIEDRWPDFFHLAPLLNPLLPLELPDNDLTAQMSGEVRADNTQRLLLEILKSQQPLVVLLEDAHWFDSASRHLMQLVSQLPRTLLVISSRPQNENEQNFVSQKIELDSLGQDEIEILICQHLGIDTLPNQVAEFIHEHAEGHPFFSEELAYALRDAGLITIENGRCLLTTDDLSKLNFPETIEGVITSRIDHLSPRQQLLLKVASVIGRVFAFRLLRDVYPLPAETKDLFSDLEVVEQLDITRVETPAPNLAYLFKHVITQGVAYNLMTFAQRRELHRSVAEWFERSYQDLSPFYPLLAHHWEEAGVLEKTLEYLEKAGEQALNNYANLEALKFFSQAIEKSEQKNEQKSSKNTIQPLRRARWQAQLGFAYLGLGQLEPATINLEKALAWLGHPSPKRIMWPLLKQLWQQALHRLGLAKFNLAKQTKNPITQDSYLEVARIIDQLAEIYVFGGDTLKTAYLALLGLNLSEKIAPSPERAKAYGMVCVAAAFSGPGWLGFGQAKRYRALAWQAASQINNLPTQARVAMLTSIYTIRTGGSSNEQWQRVENDLNQAIKICQQLGDRRLGNVSVATLADAAYYKGDLVGNYRISQDLYQTSRQNGDEQHQVWSLLMQVWSLLPWNRAEEALDLLEIAGKLLMRANDRSAKLLHASLMAKTLLRLDQSQQAKEIAQQATQMIIEIKPAVHAIFIGFESAAETLLALIGLDLSQECEIVIKSLLDWAKVMPIAQPAAWRCYGQLLWLRNKRSSAKKAWVKSLNIAKKLQMPYYQGLALLELGHFDHKYLAKAQEIFKKLDAVYEQKLSEKLASQLTN